MSRYVHWSERAGKDLRKVIGYIAGRNKTAASEFNKYIIRFFHTSQESKQ